MRQLRPSSDFSRPEAPVARSVLLAEHGVRLIETRSQVQDPAVTDLLACTQPGKRACFLLLCWEDDRLMQAEMFLTEDEARACLTHGRLYDLGEFALPVAITRFM